MRFILPNHRFCGNRKKPQKFRNSIKKPKFAYFLRVIHLIHVLDQVQHLVAVAPLVVVPGDELDEGIRELDGSA